MLDIGANGSDVLGGPEEPHCYPPCAHAGSGVAHRVGNVYVPTIRHGCD